MKPLWFRLVKEYPENYVGPTIPFLVGAQDRLEELYEITMRAVRNSVNS